MNELYQGPGWYAPYQVQANAYGPGYVAWEPVLLEKNSQGCKHDNHRASENARMSGLGTPVYCHNKQSHDDLPA